MQVKSYWKGKTDINSISIGIELDYFPNKTNKQYSKKTIENLLVLFKKTCKKKITFYLVIF